MEWFLIAALALALVAFYTMGYWAGRRDGAERQAELQLKRSARQWLK